ncbi:recombinase family protein [Lederbergia lenta]|uniref:recombinase family protein n=1 Tax=Lederbergia lenta TaxID=1467 RepID=UPI00203A7640|nr:recombinase family protein [Lederbergia lenta]MCM3112815.1 recombinase family protein [Lederbergia lenta]
MRNKNTNKKNLNGRPKAYGYARRSPNPDMESTSIEKQIEEIEKYCLQNDIELVDTFTDDLKSAKSFEGRDNFIEMYNSILRSDDIDYIIVFKQDRISRDPLDTLYILKRLNSVDKHIISITDNVNTEDPSAKILVHVLSLVAELEREFINLRTSSGMEKRAEQGRFLGGRVFGYELINKELEIIPEEAKIVKYIFEKYTKNMWGYKKIASNLNLQGVKTKKGNHWTTTAIKTILENKIYIGITKWKGKHQKGIHPPIIEESLWKETQEIMKARSYRQKKVHPGSYPLSGLMKCPECGSVMVQGNSSQKYKYYQCSKNKNSGRIACSSNLVKKEYAEEKVLDEVFQYLNSMNLIPAIENATNVSLAFELQPLEVEARYLNNKIKRIKKDMSNVIDLMNDEKYSIDKGLLKEKLMAHQENLNEINNDLKEINIQIEFKQSKTSHKLINLCATNFREFYFAIPDEERKLLLHRIIKEIHVTKGAKPKDRTLKNVVFKFNNEDIFIG